MIKERPSKKACENLIRNTWYKIKNSKSIGTKEECAIYAAVVLSLLFYEGIDRIYNSIHAQIFSHVYLSDGRKTTKVHNSQSLLKDADMTISICASGYAAEAPLSQENSICSAFPKKKKPSRKEILAYELGVGVVTLKEYTDRYVNTFWHYLKSLNP